MVDKIGRAVGDMLARYEAASAPPGAEKAASDEARRAPTSAMQDATVERLRASKSVALCTRAADLPGNSLLGARHHWLLTPNKEAGLGPLRGNIPGHGGIDLPYDPTKVVDHAGEHTRADADCFPVPNVDPDCVDEKLAIGTPQGPWVLDENDCHTFVRRIVQQCHVAPAGTEPEPIDGHASR